MLLERDRELGALDALLSGIRTTGGQVVLIRGEAGIGKSALVAEFLRAHAGEVEAAVGISDNLVTPHPLAPFWDFARQEPRLTEPLERGDRLGVLACCLDLLSRSDRPTVLVIEDTHWSDEATLDAVLYLGRRIARTNGLLVLTYRDGEVDFDHPLRAVIADLPPQHLVRIHLERLSSDAVAAMIAGSELMLDEVVALTGGNPHFVSEAVASGLEEVPPSVQDSVLGRASRLSPGARRLVDAVSVNPGKSDRKLIEAIVDAAPEHVAECVRQGLLDAVGDTVWFHHELTRRAIESALSDTERRRLHRVLLHELVGTADLSRLVHHALGAEDVESIVEYAPQAARAAMALLSFREAAAHFRTLEPYLAQAGPAEQAEVMDDWARTEFYLDHAESVSLLERAIELRRVVDDDVALARTLTFAVRVNEVNGNPDAATACSVESIRLLEPMSPSADLAFALSQRAWLGLMRSDDNEATIEFADRAIAIATDIDAELAMIYSLMSKGSIEHGRGDPGALALVEESHRLAQRGGHRFEEVYALINLTGLAGDSRRIRAAADLAQRAINAAARHQIRSSEAYAHAMYAEILQWTGDWAAAEDVATEVLGSHSHTEIIAWRVLGTLRSREGRPGAPVALDTMWKLAAASGELQNLDPAAGAIAEHIWLTGELDAHRPHLREVYEKTFESGQPWPSGSLVFWLWELGELSAVPAGLNDAYRLIIEGQPMEAARMWLEIGCPYERAIALTHGDQAAQLEALEVLETLGAAAVAAKIRKRLRDAGVRVPRGKGRATRANVGGLTARQAEVLELLDEGLSNVRIADRLFVSLRTVEHHVSAVLAKLNSATREEAVSRARANGLIGQPRTASGEVSL